MAVEKITLRVVTALGPGETVWDDTVKGFGVRRQRTAAVYVFKYRFHGRQRFLTIGRHGSPWTPDEARAEAKRHQGALVQLGRPIDPAAQRDAIGSSPAFDTLARTYLAEYAAHRKKARSLAEDRRNLELHVLPYFGHRRVCDITRVDITRWHLGQHSRPVNANRCLAVMSHIFTMAEKWGICEVGTNPCRGVGRYQEKSRDRFLSEEEFARLGTALRAVDSQDAGTAKLDDWRATACIRLLIYTGARLSEILSLQWTWIDWAQGMARLPDSKTGAKALILPPPALNLLRRIEQKQNHDDLKGKFVLPSNSRNKYFTGIQKPWQRIRLMANLPDLRLHDLRHSYASAAVAGGESLYLVGSILGHRQASTTQRYAHLSLGPVREVADRTAARIASILEHGPSRT